MTAGDGKGQEERSHFTRRKKFYEVQVYDEFVITGNTAVLRCHIPSFVVDYVSVTSWIRNTEEIHPSSRTDEKYMIIPSGELHVKDVGANDVFHSYKCRTVHRLSGESKVSATFGKIIVTDPRSSIPPRITDSKSSVVAKQGENVVLPCAGQGYPIPVYSWFVLTDDGRSISVQASTRIRPAGGNLLLDNVRPSDSATYVCFVNNTVGSEKIDTILTVIAPLSASIQPHQQVVDLGKPASFQCITSGYPISSVKWLKNGQDVSGERTSTLSRDVLRVNGAAREDRGMYQCVVSNSYESVQASMELRLGGDYIYLHISAQLHPNISPVLHSVFSEKIVQAGSVVSLECIASASPAPLVTWTLDDEPIKPTTGDGNGVRFIDHSVDGEGNVLSILNVSRVQVQDGGEYACAAKNKVGKIVHSARINVHGRPYIRPFRRKSVVAGEDVVIKCPYAGHPIESIQWERGGRKLPIDHRQVVFRNGTLLVRSVQRTPDAGTYTCLVRSPDGVIATQDLEVMVRVPPTIMPFSFPDEQLHIGMRVRVVCVVSQGDVPMTITWLKDGQPIPGELGVSVQMLDEYSSSLVIRSVTLRHNGNYTCVASNAAAAAFHSALLHANVPPKLNPPPFQEIVLDEGAQARLVCAVLDGDLPITFTWLKNGREVTSDSRVATRDFDEFTHVLTISKAHSEHSGNYTCIAHNDAASARFSARLVVNVPPRWLTEPRDTEVLAGGRVLIDCQADGFPVPRVTWMKAVENAPGDYIEVPQVNSRVRQMENGSLLVTEARPDDRGRYSCRASNGVGTGLSHVIVLEVRMAPLFESKTRNMTIRQGDQADLVCSAIGDPPLEIVWFKNSRNLNQENSAKYKLKRNKTKHGMESVLSILESSGDDTDTFRCNAKNVYGTDETLIYLTITERPSPPQSIGIIETSARFARITWTTSYDGNSPIHQYVVQFKLASASWTERSINVTVTSNENSVVLRDLQPDASYQCRVWAMNAAGPSQPSDVLSFSTTEEAPGGPPRNVQVEPTDARAVKVSWKPPRKESWNGRIRGYYVGYKVHDSSEPYAFKTVETAAGSKDQDLSVQIANLRQFTKYSFIVQAYNQAGTSSRSDEVVMLTSEDVPNQAPDNLQCSSISSQSLHVSWTAVGSAAANGILQGYKVVYQPVEEWYGGYESVTSESKVTNGLSVILSGLEKFTNYSIQVMAYTRVGDGVKSSFCYCATLEDVPDAPSDIKAVAMTMDSIIVSWKPPAHINGEIKNYNVYIRALEHLKEEITKHPIPPSFNTYEAVGLKKNRRYEFWVTAVTAVGEGQSTRVVAQSPAGPTVVARIVSFGGDVVAPWKTFLELHCKAVGMPHPEREWRFGGQLLVVDEDDRVRPLPDGTLLIKNLQEKDSGSYMCRASNSQGNDQVIYNLVVQVPPGPPSLFVTGITESSLELRWRNLNSGGAAIQGYVLNYKREFGEWEQVALGADTFSYPLSSLECGTRYQMYIQAMNKLGVGQASDILAARTKGSGIQNEEERERESEFVLFRSVSVLNIKTVLSTAPIIPVQEKFLRTESTSVILVLNSWLSGGCPILYFVVQYRLINQIEWKLVSNNVLLQHQSEFLIPDLVPATWYALRVTAHNNAGSTVAEFHFATRTIGGGTLSPLGASEDVTPSPFYYSWSILGAILAVLCLVTSVGVVCYCFRQRKQYVTDNGGGEEEKPRGGVEDKAASAGSFTYLLNTSNNKPSHNSAINYTKKGELVTYNNSDISPYATAQISQGNEMKTFSQRALAPAQMYPPLRSEFREGTYPRARKDNLQQKQQQQYQRPDKMFYSTDYTNPVTECDDLTITRQMIYASHPRMTRPSAPNMTFDFHVPDLLDHGPESSTSNDTSPETYVRNGSKQTDDYDRYGVNETRFVYDNTSRDPDRNNRQEYKDNYHKSYEDRKVSKKIGSCPMPIQPIQPSFASEYTDDFTIA
uniref:Down syndrome cell adhesion molecule-like protein Dscam2 n=1 Tax=Strigamia maritima TaxID=126957 RepID=T1JCZ7_STRMM